MISRKKSFAYGGPAAMLLAFGVLAGCAPAKHPEIEKADLALSQLKSELPAEALAGREVRDAEDAVERAKTDWRKDKDEAEALHLSYVAARRIEIARLTTRATQAEVEAARRNQLRQTAKLESEKTSVERDLADAESRNRMQADALANLQGQLQELQAKQTERGLQLTLGDVLFETDKAMLKPGAVLRLKPVADHLVAHPDVSVRIEGHTDSEGPSDYNLDLSRRRAESVKAALVSMNVSPSRVVAVGMGEEFPLAENDSSVGRQENRRVDLIIGSSPPSMVQTGR